jgi:alpha-methylacyl-CoA racemase
MTPHNLSQDEGVKRVASGPLHGFKIIEFAGIGPGPLCGMLFSDLGAEVIRIDRPPVGNAAMPEADPRELVSRGRKSIVVDLKNPDGIAVVKRLLAGADALFEGFRPGVMERLGLGPEICKGLNPKLVYGRITGWGQAGPLAKAAGHDINYIALTGALHAIGGVAGGPVPPLNLVGDYGGGALYLALGMACALLEAQRSGRGQVVDAAIVDGASSIMTAIYMLRAQGEWSDNRADNLIDSGTPWYDVYETADGKYISIGALEPQFYQILLEKIGLADAQLPARQDRANWPALRARFTARFKELTRDAWCALLEGTDACFAPVLSMEEAGSHPHIRARSTFIDFDGIAQPAPAPRFSRTVARIQSGPPGWGAHGLPILREAGFSVKEIQDALTSGAVLAAENSQAGL